MEVIQTNLSGVLVIRPQKFADRRGSFVESWHRKRYAQSGIDRDFVQDNLSYSAKGVLRGLHFQNPSPQGKLVQVLQGEVFDVAVDIRVGSPTFGKWLGMNLTAESGEQLYLPEGFAHGFVVLSKSALYSYKCTDFYDKASERTLLWDDPEIAINWPIRKPILSEKDQRGVLLKDIPVTHLFKFDSTR